MNSLLWICKDFRPFHASFFLNHFFTGKLNLTHIIPATLIRIGRFLRESVPLDEIDNYGFLQIR
jgi:hypothetical protein